MRKGPVISIPRAVEVFKEAIDVRRRYRPDGTFFLMSDFWEFLCEESETWSIKRHHSDKAEDFKRKAGVVAFDGRVTLSVDERLWVGAMRGNGFFNFLLAHELGHLVLDHHAKGAVTKNFQLYAGPNGMSNLPPTVEELETNFAAVFLQCGVALLDTRWSAMELARRAFSDADYVKKAQRAVRLDSFQQLLSRPKPERVVF